MNELIHFAVTVFAIWTANMIHACIFVKFKADKYEDVLADKIAKRVLADKKDGET